MKDYLEKRRAELKKRGNKGFTLMEMLIVVAIIAVLIAIAIPIFTSQLENSREATDAANLRSAYAEVSAAALTEDTANQTKEVKAQQTDGSKWNNDAIASGTIGDIKVADIDPTTGSWTVAWDATNNKVTISKKS